MIGRGLEGFQRRSVVELQSSGVAELDAMLGGGFPRGSLVELCGPASSGRTSVAFSLLAQATERQQEKLFERARKQIQSELSLIEKLHLAGYFMIVWDIIRFCREQEILVQGRGSAANSAVCYSLGITAVDPVEGVLQNQDHTISIKASRVLPISITSAETQSHDFY